MLTTVIAAAVGFLLNSADAQGSRAASNGQLDSEQASAGVRSAYEQAESDYFAYLVRRSQQDAQSAAKWNRGLDPAHGASWESAVEAWGAALNATAIPADLNPTASTGPDLDPSFPTAFFTQRSMGATSLQAKADQENLVAAQWGKLGGTYAVILTMLGISLFLFGTATQLLARNRLLFAATGIGLVLVGGAWVGVTTADQPRGPSDTAAAAYTAGVRDLSLATTPAAYQAAIDAFSRAIAARPDYARAYAQRAAAEVNRGAVGLTFGYATYVVPRWLNRALQDYEQAYADGIQSEDVLFGLAFGRYQQWLVHGTEAPPPEILQLTNQAVQLDGQNPIAWLNKAVYELVAGDVPDSKASFHTYLEYLIFTNPAKRERRQENLFQAAIVATGLSALDDLQHSPAPRQHPAITGAINGMRASLTATIATGDLAFPSDDALITSTSVPSSDAQIIRDADHLVLTFPAPSGWDVDHGGMNLADQPVVVAWYARDTAHGGQWNALSEATQWSSKSSASAAIAFGGGRYFAGAGEIAAHRCLSPAQYRADVFVAGHRLLSISESSAGGLELVPKLRGDLGLGACVPASWTVQESAASGAGQSFVLMSPDGSEGAVMMRVFESTELLSGTDNAALANALVSQTIQLIVRDAATYGLPAQPFGEPLSLVGAGSHGTFADLNGVTGIAFSSGGTAVVAGGGLIDEPNDKALVVGMVFGPASGFTAAGSRLNQVYDSFGLAG